MDLDYSSHKHSMFAKKEGPSWRVHERESRLLSDLGVDNSLIVNELPRLPSGKKIAMRQSHGAPEAKG